MFFNLLSKFRFGCRCSCNFDAEFSAILVLLLLIFLCIWPLVLFVVVALVLSYSGFSRFKEISLENFLLFILIVFFKFILFSNSLFNHIIAYRANILHCLFTFSIQYVFFFQFFFLIPHIKLFFLLSGDVESNPGPFSNSLTICHWNLNSVPAHNFAKLTHLGALASTLA